MTMGLWRRTDRVAVWLVAASLCVLPGDAPVQGSGASDREAMAAPSNPLTTASPRPSSGNTGAPSDLFVPVILTASGASNSYYTSELTLTNRGSSTATLRYTYTAAAGGGSGAASETLAPGRQKILPNAIDYLRSLGIPIPSSGTRIGTLRVGVSRSSEVSVTVRTTTQVADGRAGLAYPGVAVAGGFTEAVYLCGLRQNRQDRSNVAFQNMGASGNITVRATVFSGDSGDSRVLPDVVLAPGGFRQLNGVLATAGFTQGYVKVERVSGTAPFCAYGVINDQANSDGSFVFPVTQSSLAGVGGQTLPVIIEHPDFSSELIVTNFSDEAKAVDFGFVADGIATQDRTARFFLTLEAGEQRILAGIVEEMRRQGVAGLGPAGGTLAGAVFATERSGDLSGVVIGARTGSPGGGGQYSVFYNAVPDGAAFAQEAWIDALQQNEENRSNLALVNTGEVDNSPGVFQLDLYDGATGMLANTVTGIRIPARGWRQINGILGEYAPGTTQGYVRIQKISGDNPFLAYGVINDGGAPGQRSGDGAFLPASGATERIDDPGTSPATDREVLEALYEATGGPEWNDRTNWLSEEPLGEWYGVRTDGAGRVTSLFLGGNQLSGAIPPELGRLTQLQELSLEINQLSGAIPPELGRLANLQKLVLGGNQLSGTIPPELGRLTQLQELSLWEANLAGPIPPELGRLANLQRLGLWRNQLSGAIPPELGRLANLQSLGLGYNLLTGSIPPELGNIESLEYLELNNNGLLDGTIPPELGSLNNLRRLKLGATGLGGPIPPELGDLAQLEYLSAWFSGFTGPIPPELGKLQNLKELDLGFNYLEGPIPAELGNLSSLTRLGLSYNEYLSGEIPGSLGNLTSLNVLSLGRNQLTGPIPPGLGNLEMLESLHLHGNQLTGSVPAWLPRLEALRSLKLYNNALSGSLPEGMGSLQQLEELWVGNNPEMSGSLPLDMAEIAGIEIFKAGGTALCAPEDDVFLEWLAGITFHRVARCVGSAAYLTQAVQSRTNPVPLIAGDPALLRAFVASPDADGETIPPARVTLYLDGSLVHEIEIEAGSGTIPGRIEESEASLERSLNADVPGELVRPGLEFVVDVDPEGVLDPALAVTGRIPSTGRMAVDVVELQDLQLTVVPFLHETEPDSSILEITEGMADDPGGHPMLEHVRVLLPVGGIDLELHAPVLTSDNFGFQILQQTEMIRQIEGRPGYWLGMQGPVRLGLLGVALGIPSWSSFSQPLPFTIAHEIGHNMGLWHAPCGGAGGPDPLFPHPIGLTDAWGYDRQNRRLISPYSPDLMSYCGGQWIGDYHHANALRHRLSTEADSGMAQRVPSLVVWGGVDENGKPYLEPAFLTEAMPTVPPEGVGFTLRGTTEDGGKAFSLRFDMPATQDAQEGRRGFVFSVPVTWTGTLDSIVLSAGRDAAVLNRDTNRPFSILRDRTTGKVRGFLRTRQPMAATAATVDAMGAVDYEMIFSVGIPDSK